MKIMCEKSDLLNAITIASNAVSQKTTMEILECIVIEAANGVIKLITNDMEIGIETIVKGIVEEEGTVAISAKVLSEYIRKLPNTQVVIVSDDNYNMTFTCEKSEFKYAGRDPIEFPSLPEVNRSNGISLSEFSLKEIIRQTVFSISDNENNKIMTGELFEIKQDNLRLISLDGHRVSIRKIKLKESYEDAKVIVPGKTLSKISRILTGGVDDMVDVYFTNKHIVFDINDTMVLSRLIEGEFFNIDSMLTDSFETKIRANKKDFYDCIDRSSLLVRETEKKPIILNIKDDQIHFKIASSLGKMKEDMDITKEGKDLKIGFNPKFLMDALKVIDDEDIDIYMFNPKSPCFIRNEDSTYIYLILPVNFIDTDEES